MLYKDPWRKFKNRPLEDQIKSIIWYVFVIVTLVLLWTGKNKIKEYVMTKEWIYSGESYGENNLFSSFQGEFTPSSDKYESHEMYLSSEASDIKGMTKKDKEDAGLLSYDGSDTDGDGLTDKEEIEKYKSDPLKVSTAGDMYTDKEKVELGLPLDKTVEAKDVSYNNNRCEEVVLEGNDASDRQALVFDYTSEFLSKRSDERYGNASWAWKVKNPKVYYVSNFEGNISIPLEEGEDKVYVCNNANTLGKAKKQSSFKIKENIFETTIDSKTNPVLIVIEQSDAYDVEDVSEGDWLFYTDFKFTLSDMALNKCFLDSQWGFFFFENPTEKVKRSVSFDRDLHEDNVHLMIVGEKDKKKAKEIIDFMLGPIEEDGLCPGYSTTFMNPEDMSGVTVEFVDEETFAKKAKMLKKHTIKGIIPGMVVYFGNESVEGEHDLLPIIYDVLTIPFNIIHWAYPMYFDESEVYKPGHSHRFGCDGYPRYIDPTKYNDWSNNQFANMPVNEYIDSRELYGKVAKEAALQKESPYKASDNSEELVKEVQIENSERTEKINTFALPFKNFTSYISEGGNCAGLALIAAKAYNTNTVDTKGEFDFSNFLYKNDYLSTNSVVSFDFGNVKVDDRYYEYLLSSAFKTGNGKPSDCHSYAMYDDVVDYPLEKYNSATGFTKATVDTVGINWALGNTYSSDTDIYVNGSGPILSAKLIKEMVDFIDQNKMLVCQMNVYVDDRNGSELYGGHAVNIFKYEFDANTGIYRFYIYDSNYDNSEYYTNKYMEVIPVELANGEMSFMFSYVFTDGFYSNSNCQDYRFLITDHERNNFTQEYGINGKMTVDEYNAWTNEKFGVMHF